jgi:hypothetical protein
MHCILGHYLHANPKAVPIVSRSGRTALIRFLPLLILKAADCVMSAFHSEADINAAACPLVRPVIIYFAAGNFSIATWHAFATDALLSSRH